MASLTSLYLCSRTVYAAVGSPTAKGARITTAAAAQLPEGCLINGVITNEADLAEALKAFFARHKLPTGRVALIVGGSQFVHRVISLPAMSEKKRLIVLAHELSTGGAETTAPLDDYMLLARDGRSKNGLRTAPERNISRAHCPQGFDEKNQRGRECARVCAGISAGTVLQQR